MADVHPEPPRPAFAGLADAADEIAAARRFVEALLRRTDLTPQQVEELRLVLDDLAALPHRLPENGCDITISTGYGDEDIGGTEFHTFSLDDTRFELSSGGTSWSAPVGEEDFIDGFRFVAEANGGVWRKMPVGPWIEEVEACCTDPTYRLEMIL